MCRLGVPFRLFAVFLCGRGVLFPLVVLTVIMVMSRLEVVMSSSLVLCSRILVMFARGVFLFVRHFQTSQMKDEFLRQSQR